MYQPLVEVDLTKGAITSYQVPTRVREAWVGGTGLGMYLLSLELTPTMTVGDPQCPVFLLAGPLAGTELPSSSDIALTTVNADIPHHVNTSHGHAFFAARLRHAGWDGVILRGKSDELVYLWIDGEKTELRSAEFLRGCDTFETVRRLSEKGNGEQVSVVCIGPAGEHLVAGSSLRVDMFSGMNHGGGGIAFGAKNLKAIAVRASNRRPEAHDPAELARLADAMREGLERKAATAVRAPFGRKSPYLDLEKLKEADEFLRSRGGKALGLNNGPIRTELGRVHGRNHTDQQIGVRFGRRLKADLEQWKVEPVASFNCDLACHHLTTCTTGAMAGLTCTGFAAEALEEMGPNLGIEDPSIALGLANLIDGYGLAASSAPSVIAMLMEAFNAGEITLKDTGGIDLTWGNHESVAALLEMTVQRQGIGEIIAQGIHAAATAFGTEHRAVHMKWGGFQDYDQRATPLFLFQSQIASGAGPTGVMHTSLAWGGLEPDLGITQPLDPADLSYIAETTYRSQVRKYWQDCIGLCQFACQGVDGGLALQAAAVQAATGQAITSADALNLGERIVNLQRVLQLRLGFRPAEDFVIAERLLEKLKDGPATGYGMTKTELQQARDAYYAFLGWSTTTGAPSQERLAELQITI